MDAIYPITTLNHSYQIAVNLFVYTAQKVWYNILLHAVIGEHGKVQATGTQEVKTLEPGPSKRRDPGQKQCCRISKGGGENSCCPSQG